MVIVIVKLPVEEVIAGFPQVRDDIGLVVLPDRGVQRLAEEDAVGVTSHGLIVVAIGHLDPVSAAGSQVGSHGHGDQP